jgi:hypothetical protein
VGALARIAAALAAVVFLTRRTASSSTTPRGKGLFIRKLEHGGEPDQLAAFVRDLGVSWVAVEVLWQEPGESDNLHGSRLAEYTAALNAAGVQVWVWLFPSPDGVSRAVDRVRYAYQVAPSVRGVIVDPEKPFYAKRHAEAAARLMAGLAELGRPIGVTSYGMPSWHPAFPWKSWVRHAAFGTPQLYSDRGSTYAPTAIAEWTALGFPAIVPALGASATHDGAEMTRLASYLPTVPAVVWWDLYHLVGKGPAHEARRAAVRGARV